MKKLALGLLLRALFLAGCGSSSNNSGGGRRLHRHDEHEHHRRQHRRRWRGLLAGFGRYRRAVGRPLLGELRSALQRLPRRGVGAAGGRRAGSVRAAVPRGLPVGPLVADAILRKRESFRAAFSDFDPERVARFGERDVKRLLADAGIVRHRGKIEATIANARATVALRDSGSPLPELVWSHRVKPGRAPRSAADWRSTTPESVELSKALRRAGFRFVGPTTVYAAMQACGVVNDHLATCPAREPAERAFAAARAAGLSAKSRSRDEHVTDACARRK